MQFLLALFVFVLFSIGVYGKDELQIYREGRRTSVRIEKKIAFSWEIENIYEILSAFRYTDRVGGGSTVASINLLDDQLSLHSIFIHETVSTSWKIRPEHFYFLIGRNHDK